MSQFAFLQLEFAPVFDHARKAEELALYDPRGACFYARFALETAVKWMYDSDNTLRYPYDNALSALIFEPTFRKLVGNGLVTKAKIVKDLGNRAVHDTRKIAPETAASALRELFHFSYWLVRTYAKSEKPGAGLQFSCDALPRTAQVEATTLAKLQEIARRFVDKKKAQEEAEAARIQTEQQRDELQAEIKRLRDEIAAVKAANQAAPDTHDYNEAETRDAFIDLLLHEAGWPLDQERDREFPVTGMPNETGEGFVDYVLWGDDGKPLALVEAKRTRRDARVGQQQAKLYADCLEEQFGRRPVIFYTNGYEHWLWDDEDYPPRAVQGFYKKDELELMVQRRSTRQELSTAQINQEIVERPYQHRAIRRIAESFEQDHDRKALLVMATGAGKTRVVIALADLLMRCNWAKRILFLADRVALVNQTVKAFKVHLPAAAPVNLVTDKSTEGRVYISTYPTMMGLIDETKDGKRRFGVGHFDLVVIDEAHRSVYQKYGAIFDYFDSLLVGLTATPKDEIGRNTYRLFDLEDGVPTDAYGLDEAVRDKFLVPPKAVSVPLRFQREGIKYEDLSEEEKDQWDALEWDEEGNVPDAVGAQAVNRWLFNADTVDKVLGTLMTRGLKVAGGDRLGKTIIFAKNHDHAVFIAERFDVNYPHLTGHFARVIDFKTEYAQSLIDDFSYAHKAPHIAISIDMLDTGIDVPEIVNLVFFKIVRSKTKFWQMIGRGTRLRTDLFGPDKPKEFFCVFDFCQNLEFFSQDLDATEGAVSPSLSKRLFLSRLGLITAIDKRPEEHAERELRDETLGGLREEVAAMNLDNFIVRPKRKYVETYAKAEAWNALGVEQKQELVEHVAGLPTELAEESEEAKRFDLLMLQLELAVLRGDSQFEKLKKQVRAIASALEEQSSIPMIRAQLALIQELQSDEYWEDVTAPMLEIARKRLRDLVKLIEKRKRKIVYTDFEDEIGGGTAIDLPGVPVGMDFERFKTKVRHFLKAHEDHIVIHKLRRNEQLTETDLKELEQMVSEAAVGGKEHIAKAREVGLGLFVRSLVGLDRNAVNQAFSAFLSGQSLSANQIEFVNLIIEHLTQEGIMKPERLYESPFTDVSPLGVDGVFESEQVTRLLNVLDNFRSAAA